MECYLCPRPATDLDTDMEMWLCQPCYAAYNGIVEYIELNEVF